MLKEHSLIYGEGEGRATCLAEDILKELVSHYRAKGAVLFKCELGNLKLMASWPNSFLEHEIKSGDSLLSKWQEQYFMNRCAYIPDVKSLSSELAAIDGMSESILGILQTEGGKPSLLLLLGNIEFNKEFINKSYDLLEASSNLLRFNSRFFREEAQEDDQDENKKPLLQAFDGSGEAEYYKLLLKGCEAFCEVDIATTAYKTIKPSQNNEYKALKLENFDELLQCIVNTEIHPKDREIYLNKLETKNFSRLFHKEGNEEESFSYRRKNKQGQYCWKKDVLIYLEAPNKSVIIITYDIDAQKQREQLKISNHLKEQEMVYSREIHRKDEIYRIIGEQSRVSAFEWGRSTDERKSFTLSYINSDLASRFEFYRIDIHLFTHLIITNRVHKADLERFCEFVDNKSSESQEIVCRITEDGYDYFWYQLTKQSIFVDGQEERMIGTLLNVDAKTRAGLALKRKSRIDALTGLMNQETFYAEADKLLSKNKDREYAIIIMDIENFKLINSLYGMSAGDQVLAQIGQTLKGCIGKQDLCARVYADVFYIALEYRDDETIIELIEKMMERLTYAEYGSLLLPCFGISKSTETDRTTTLLCELASFAHKHGKWQSRERYMFYDDSIRRTIIEEKQMESEMEFALQSGQFKVYLQPKYVISTCEIIGAEALVRWEHPTRGMIVPIKFISLFEKNGFILRLDEYIWEQVCLLLNKWQASGVKCIPISVNMSRLHLNNRDFQSTIVNLLKKYQIRHKWFELELTENLLFENLGQMISVLTDLQHQGFYINMDDFGSGYSSLNMLRNIPIDVLKIDGNFFDEKMLTPKGKTIVKYVVSMAKELNMQVVAEGVENHSQELFLLEVGCEIAQGFYFSRPLTVSAFESKCWNTTKP